MSLTDPDSILLHAEEHMEKAVDHLKHEFRGIRTGRANPSMVEYVKVDYYGSPTDLKSLAAISVPEPTQILIKPFDAQSVGEIKKAIESSGMGFNPIVEAKQIRVTIPALSTQRRQQLVSHVKKLSEDQKVAVRNVRRDANKHAEALAKATTKHVSEDEVEQLKNEIQELLKKYEADIDKRAEEKTKEIMEV